MDNSGETRLLVGLPEKLDLARQERSCSVKITDNFNHCGRRIGESEGKKSSALFKSNEIKRNVLVAANLLAVAVAALGMTLVPRSERVAVVVAPWSPPVRIMDVVRQADGSLVGASRLSWVVVSEGKSAGFVQRLYAAGALLVLDGSFLSGCLARGN